MTRKGNLKLVTATLLVSTTLLSACGTNDGESKSTQAQASAASSIPETGLPISKELQTVKIQTVIADGQPASKDIRFWAAVEKESNIHPEFLDTSVSQWKEKKGLIFASNDLPEAFIGNGILEDIDLLNLGTQGQIIPLEGLIEKYAPNLKKAFQDYPDLKKQITAPDGHIYAIPSFDDGSVPTVTNPLFMNKAWLDKLGLKPPATTDEFEQVLKAFKTQDPNGNGKADEIPFTATKDNNYSYFSDLFGAFGLIDDYDTHIGLKDNKAIFTVAQPEFKDAITYLHKLYAQGLIDQESYTQDGKGKGAKVKTVPRIVGTTQEWRSTSWATKPEEKGDYIAIAPLKGPKGDALWPQRQNGLLNRGSFAITKAAKNPALLMRWVDNLLADDNAIQMSLSFRMGDVIEKTSDNRLKTLRVLDPNNKDEAFNTPGNYSRITFKTKKNADRLIEQPAQIVEKWEYDKLYAKSFPKQQFPKVFFSADEAMKLATTGKDIKTYANSMYAKWTINGVSDKEWDDYLKKLNDMGLNEYVAIYQKAYERYSK